MFIAVCGPISYLSQLSNFSPGSVVVNETTNSYILAWPYIVAEVMAMEGVVLLLVAIAVIWAIGGQQGATDGIPMWP